MVMWRERFLEYCSEEVGLRLVNKTVGVCSKSGGHLRHDLNSYMQLIHLLNIQSMHLIGLYTLIATSSKVKCKTWTIFCFQLTSHVFGSQRTQREPTLTQGEHSNSTPKGPILSVSVNKVESWKVAVKKDRRREWNLDTLWRRCDNLMAADTYVLMCLQNFGPSAALTSTSPDSKRSLWLTLTYSCSVQTLNQNSKGVLTDDPLEEQRTISMIWPPLTLLPLWLTQQHCNMFTALYPPAHCGQWPLPI